MAVLFSVWLYSRRWNFTVLFFHEDVMAERILSSKFRALTEPLGIRDQFSSPAFYVPCCIYFGSLALRRSQVERGETDPKVVYPSSSVTLQRVWMSGESWVSGLNNLGDDVWISLTLYGSAGTWELPVCVPPASLSPCGSQRAEPSINAGPASNSGNHCTYTILPLRNVSGECVPSCFCASEGFHVHANPLRVWAKAKLPINIVK